MKNIGYSEFVKLGNVWDPENWCDWLSVRLDGVYIKSLPSGVDVTPIERAIWTKHPLHDLTKPVLAFPCSLEELRAFDEYQRLGLDLDGLDEGAQQAAPTSERLTPAALLIVRQQEAEQSVTHKIRTRTPSILDAEICQAKKQALNPDDKNSVWTELVKMAEKKTGCLLGLDGRDIKYQAGDEVLFFKKRSLNERMNRAAPGRIETHHDAQRRASIGE